MRALIGRMGSELYHWLKVSARSIRKVRPEKLNPNRSAGQPWKEVRASN